MRIVGVPPPMPPTAVNHEAPARRQAPAMSRLYERLDASIAACREAPRPGTSASAGTEARDARCAHALAELRREIEHEKATAAAREASLLCGAATTAAGGDGPPPGCRRADV